MRTIWNGTLHFGLVRIPVGLAPTSTAGEIEFRTLHRECGTPIKQKQWCPHHDRVVESSELVKGWEIAPGEFVIVEDEELAGLKPEGTSRAIELLGFVPVAEIDPIALDRCYYLAPSESPVGRRPYAAFSDALEKTGRAALVRYLAWGKERIAVVRPVRTGLVTLVLHNVKYAEELISTDEIEKLLADTKVLESEGKLAQTLVKRIAIVNPASVDNAYARRVQRLLEDKIAGKKIVRAKAPKTLEADEPPADLAGALRRSVRAATAKPKTQQKRSAAAPAKKSTAAPARPRRRPTKT